MWVQMKRYSCNIAFNSNQGKQENPQCLFGYEEEEFNMNHRFQFYLEGQGNSPHPNTHLV
jgi:hypothetical protein